MLNKVLDGLGRLRDPINREEAISILQEAADKTEQVMDDEQEALDNRPENLYWSTANDDMNDNISDLADAQTDLEVLVDDCENMSPYSYAPIKAEVIKIVNLIKQVINR